jgi:hypothetical protein
MRLLVAACCLALVACASPRPASVETAPADAPPGEAWILRGADSTRALLSWDAPPAYRALLDSLSTGRVDSLRFGAFPGFDSPTGVPPGYRVFRGAPLAAPSRCDRATPMPQVITPDSLAPAPMPRIESEGPPPVPIPNWCDQ